MYTLLVCADLYGEKVNLELTFPTMPTIQELQRKVMEVFGYEAQLKRPAGYQPTDFSIARLQVYDDVLLKWGDLVTCTQLHEYDQLYAFQPQSPWHIDVQKDLPPPRPPTTQTRGGPPPGSATYGAPPPQASPYYAAGASPAPGTPYGATQQYNSMPTRRTGSPTQDRLAEQRAREEQLRAELARVQEETSRLQQEAAREEADQRRREEEEQTTFLRQREAEIARQREALRTAEEEFQRAQAQAAARRK